MMIMLQIAGALMFGGGILTIVGVSTVAMARQHGWPAAVGIWSFAILFTAVIWLGAALMFGEIG